ncbi:MAG: glycosyltransferase family 2 protein [Polyangiaceae bacterium]|jgi:glycosyltransferase involved in cell wall biosynthesis
MTSLAPRVSVCIPTLSARRLPYLAEAIASARAQTCPEIEIIVSDDGEDAPVRDFAEAQMRLDGRIRYRRNPKRLGLGGNWNAVAGDARGEYLVIIGDDDRLLPRFVEALLSAGRVNTAVLFSNHHVIDASGKRLEALTREFLVKYAREELPAGELSDAAACVWRNSIPMSSSLVRTADVQRLGIKPDLNTPEIELFARLATEHKSFVFVPEYLAEYRVHPQSQTAAGLAAERLIRYLDPIEVTREVEPLKRRYMNDLLASAVTKAFEAGDVEGARTLMRHRYYPSVAVRPARVLVHRMVGALPTMVAARTFAAVNGTGRRFLRAVRGG